MGELLAMIKYKTAWYNRGCYVIDTFYPSSKTCSKCGYVLKRQLKVTDRSWICPKCKSKLDRDMNAAINIRNEGMKLYKK